MNKPSKDDNEHPNNGGSQTPSTRPADLSIHQDLSETVNARTCQSHPVEHGPKSDSIVADVSAEHNSPNRHGTFQQTAKHVRRFSQSAPRSPMSSCASNYLRVLVKYAKYVGPGAMVSVAYIDPGNYATDAAAGVSYRFKLLFVVLLSNLIAVFLQSLCIKLGCVSGKNLAQMCKTHLPSWLNWIVYVFAEGAIIATDIAEVIGTAIALNLLFHIPVVAGCAISIVDVLVILLVYRPGGSLRALRAFELFVLALVLGVVICFSFQLSLLPGTNVGEVFKGYLPSSALVESKGLYQSIGILGATVMPHSLYLGSGMVQPRLFDLDKKSRAESAIASPSDTTLMSENDQDPTDDLTPPPLLSSIRSCISYSTVELTVSLTTFALFVNSAILIIAGSALSNSAPNEDSASLFSIHDLLTTQLSKAAGVVFALALLLSGTSAGIVCTIAGQMVSEGHLSLDWAGKPWVRRLITRSIAITPSIIIAGAVGTQGLSSALEASQVALSIILPFVSAPVIWFTCFGSYMVVHTCAVDNTVSMNMESYQTKPATNHCPLTVSGPASATASAMADPEVSEPCLRHGLLTLIRRKTPTDVREPRTVNMRSHWATSVLALAIWCLIVVMNVAALVFLGEGVG